MRTSGAATPGGLPPWLRGELGTGRIVSATEMSDCMGEGAWPGCWLAPAALVGVGCPWPGAPFACCCCCG